ncbi:MAG: tRNA lysidine(34) synthetase TilS [Bacteroidales bacterium]|nr:tRNA lysidine(34) synthetase TilS [Candidatus Physcousia equi]
MSSLPSHIILPPLSSDGTKPRLLVGVSGGADSVALLLLLHDCGYELVAVHCNFQLRGSESLRDEDFVRQLCSAHHIPLEVLTFDTTRHAHEHGISIEMAARNLRYEAFEQLRQQHQADFICVAHHQQDQAETLLLNLCRGTGLRGLCGMAFRHGNVLRPLLHVSRNEIEAYLNERAQPWVTDSTNLEREAMRNIIRLDVLPLLQRINPRAVENMARTASHVQESLPYFERGVEQECTSRTPATRTALHEMLRGCGFTATQERDIWHAQTGRIIQSPTHRLVKDRNQYILYIYKEGATTYVGPLNERLVAIDQLAMKKGCAYFDADQLPRPVTLRRLQQGDRFQPFGMKGSKLVSDLLTDMKINRIEKERQLVLCDALDNIIWVVGRRASNLYRITEKTRNVVEFSI